MKSEKLNLSELDKLARLMATENIIVQHGQTQTAYFDTEGRILMLPMWKDVSKSLYHMLTSHEIGHALYTPADGWKQMIVNEQHLQAYANILEDARIEKLVKNKYPGSRKDFREGYQELFDRDFFQLKSRGTNMATLCLADRINLHYKIGHIVPIPFAKDELKWLDRVEALKTFDDVLALSRELFKEQQKQKQQQPSTDQEHGQGEENDKNSNGKPEKGSGDRSEKGESGNRGDEDEGDEGQENQPGQSDPNYQNPSKGVHANQGEDEDGEGEGEGSGGTGGEEDDSDPNELKEGKAGTDSGRISNSDLGGSASTESIQTNEPWTNSSMESGLSQRIIDKNAKPFRYLTLDVTVPSEEFVISYKEIVEQIRKENALDQRLTRNHGKHFKRLTNRNRNSVNYLIKEFELRKAADVTKRTKVTKTGVLNPTRLHAYKFTDDIFRRGQYVADGKNHSIVMFVDFSGSMNGMMKDTIEHLFNLVSFCRKANIPHKVYAFTNAHQGWRYDQNSIYDQHAKRMTMMKQRANGKSDLLTANMDMHLLELYSHDMSVTDFRDMTEALVENFHSKNNYIRQYRMFDLNSTPLDGAVVLAHKIIRQFKEATKTEIVSAIFLTDGDSSGACVLNRSTAQELNSYCDQNTILQKRFNSYRNKAGTGYGFMTEMLMRSLANEGYHVIGYRIGGIYELERQLTGYGMANTSEISKKVEELKKDGSCTLRDFRGYQEYHYLVMDSVKSSEKFNLNDDYETTESLENAFIAETTGRLVSRRILSNIARKISGKVKPE